MYVILFLNIKSEDVKHVLLTTVTTAHAEIKVTVNKNMAILRHRLSATIRPGGTQLSMCSKGVSVAGFELQHPSNQHKYTKTSRTMKVGPSVPYNIIPLPTIDSIILKYIKVWLYVCVRHYPWL